jgi:hypothetical protein
MRLKASSWGVVPDDEELADFLHEVSERHYGGRYLPAMHLFNEQRPGEWRQSLAILHAHKLPGTPDGWQQLMVRLGFSLEVAPRGVAAKPLVRRHRKEQALDAPLDAMPSLAEATQMVQRDGLPVVGRLRPVRVWCPQRHCYVTVGQRQVWEVR